MSETKLSESAIQQLLLVKGAILSSPERYDQSTFARNTACGTTCCIAGWIDRLNFSDSAFRRHFKRQRLPYSQLYSATKPWESKQYSFAVSAAQILGLNEEQKLRLFGEAFEHWPRKFQGIDGNPRAEDAAARIDHFIATDGAE